MSATTPELIAVVKPPLYRDVRVLRWVFQIAAVVATLGVLWWLYNNAITNLQSANLPTGFDFLDRESSFAIPGLEDSAKYSIRKAYLAGYLNTLRVILIGIPACTVLGILIGIARLSDNMLVRAFGTVYVETFRNIPVLLWIFVTYLVIILSRLPQLGDNVTPLDAFVISNRGIGIPWLNADASVMTFLGFLGIGIIAVVLVSLWRRKANEKTGLPSHAGLFGIIAFLIALAIAHVASGNALSLDPAKISDNGRQVTGGLNVFPPYLGLTLALTLYTASHVAEIVRGSIQSIHSGQAEAANAIALTTFQRYRFVILPQAFRVMIPPLASQYLNITKNSSLAVAISYVEITSIFQRVSNNATPALQALIVLMFCYLTFSLGISVIANIFNRRLALESR